jgi:hypothetical protein
VYTATAKIDLTGLDSPQVFEIKPSPNKVKKSATNVAVRPVNIDIDLLLQVLERMSVEIYCIALLSTFTVLAATGRFAWVAVFERKLEFFNSPDFEVITSDLLKVFFSNVERSAQEPGWHLTKDAPHLFNTIGRLSYPCLCSTRLYEKSESNVYAVSLPRTYGNKHRLYVGPATSHVDLMIKVVHSELSFKTESTALAEVAPAYNRLEPQDQEDRHYALGVCSYPSKEEEKEEEKKEEKKEAVILRNVKIAVPDFFSISALTETFRTEFDGTAPCGKRFFVEGSLYSSLGPRLANVDLQTTVEWTSADDYEMAMKSMEELADQK